MNRLLWISKVYVPILMLIGGVTIVSIYYVNLRYEEKAFVQEWKMHLTHEAKHIISGLVDVGTVHNRLANIEDSLGATGNVRTSFQDRVSRRVQYLNLYADITRHRYPYLINVGDTRLVPLTKNAKNHTTFQDLENQITKNGASERYGVLFSEGAIVVYSYLPMSQNSLSATVISGEVHYATDFDAILLGAESGVGESDVIAAYCNAECFSGLVDIVLGDVEEQIKGMLRYSIQDHNLFFSLTTPIFSISRSFSLSDYVGVNWSVVTVWSIVVIGIGIFLMALFRVVINRAIRVEAENSEIAEVVHSNLSEYSDQKSLYDNFKAMMNRDLLTGLPNKTHLMSKLESYDYSEGNSFIVMLSINEFEHINATYGHDAGDLTIVDLANLSEHFMYRYAVSVFKDFTIARVSGSEIVLLFTEGGDRDVVTALLDELSKKFVSKVFESVGKVTLAVGVLELNKEIQRLASNTQLLMVKQSMQRANSDGGGIVYFADVANTVNRERLIEMQLVKAIKEGAFSLKFMPIYSLKRKEVTKIEVLVRCPLLKEFGVGPDEFIPVAEKNGLIQDIDMIVLSMGIDFVRHYNETVGPMRFSFNLSSIHLSSLVCIERIIEIVEASGVASSLLEFEITETALPPDFSIVVPLLKKIKSMGSTISIDDFGSGYTSFKELTHYPVDSLKIDKEFLEKVRGFKDDDPKMIVLLYRLAKAYGVDVTVEGVEREYQMNYLAKMGVDCLQGYYISRPVSSLKIIDTVKSLNNQKAKKTSLLR
ncbi:GGDEF domain-containing phosphodiesterase [Vibrio barjaei]|uniref:GGDEF domain-containing phosphodiesterase n=1 Tax=Vibrio barjaei TaxID=1676683 RepID=UPI002284ACF2|nr:GGDEF domain-containing phosphodiesterase [Vibrio barjaei]MCY9874516.1 GGDEF domain-containing phosphodiesterase [Vibrio barjaei]